MKLRARDSSDIRRDAISMAAKKLASGCGDCADGYLKLAREHGAGEGELTSVRASGKPVTVTEPMREAPSRISVVRREIAVPSLAVTGASAAAAALASPVVAADTVAEKLRRLREHDEVFKPSKVRMDPFGVDGSTSLASATAQGMPLNFYIGELGYGTCSNCGPCGGCGCQSCFQTDSANHVGIWYTYGYWGLQGPGLNPGGITNFQWGQRQADAFVNAWTSGPYASYVYGQTFFADVENGFGGWSNYNYGPNEDVVTGFINRINYWGRYYGVTFTPGVYIGLNDINGPNHYYFDPSWVSSAFVFWVTQDQTCAPCAPCSSSCNTLTDVQNRWNNTIRHACFAGNGAVVWQYWVGSCGCGGDFDYTPQSANTYFTPVGCS